MQRFDKVVVLVTIVILLGWSIAPIQPLTGGALVILAGLHVARLMRWLGKSTFAEPLVLVLHMAYAFIPLGSLFIAVSILAPQTLSQATAVHVWTAGAIGLMTVGVMTRASLGHLGYPLIAGPTTTMIYLALTGSVFFRVVADFVPDWRDILLNGSALLWIVCFAGFVLFYGPMLLRTKRAPEE